MDTFQVGKILIRFPAVIRACFSGLACGSSDRLFCQPKSAYGIMPLPLNTKDYFGKLETCRTAAVLRAQDSQCILDSIRVNIAVKNRVLDTGGVNFW